MNDRKGILDDVEKAISCTFYKNEVDATKYYSDRMIRKKQLGGRYNEKFLDYDVDETTDIEDEREYSEIARQTLAFMQGKILLNFRIKSQLC